MVKNIEKQRHGSLINNKIRKAAFVSLDSDKSETFKYSKIDSIVRYKNKIILSLKRGVNTFLQKIKLKLSFFDWKVAKESSFVWITEAAIEGLLINFATHHLFGLEITPWTVISYGIIVKETIDIYKRLKDGTNTKLIKKD